MEKGNEIQSGYIVEMGLYAIMEVAKTERLP